jgi:hypothetical protein
MVTALRRPRETSSQLLVHPRDSSMKNLIAHFVKDESNHRLSHRPRGWHRSACKWTNPLAGTRSGRLIAIHACATPRSNRDFVNDCYSAATANVGTIAAVRCPSYSDNHFANAMDAAASAMPAMTSIR